MDAETGAWLQAYTMVHHVVYEHTTLLFNRHLDQLLLGALYGTCKVCCLHICICTRRPLLMLPWLAARCRVARSTHAHTACLGAQQAATAAGLEARAPRLRAVRAGELPEQD